MRYLLLALLVSLVALCGLADTADAQSCTPRPAIAVDQHPDGYVGISGTALV